MKQEDFKRKEEGRIRVPELENNLIPVGFIMMNEVFKDDGISFNTKSQYKGADMNSFEMAHLSPEVLEMFNRSSIHASELCDFLLQSNEQDRTLMPYLLNNLLDICGVYSHNDLHHLLNSSTVMDLPGGFLSIFFNFSIYSFFIGNSSTGCQSISSQNFSSSLDNCLCLMNSSNNLLLFDSSLATSDQFTQGKRSNLSLNLSSIGVIKLTIYNTPLACNFSNTSSLFLIPSFITSGQLMSGCLSNFSLNSLDTDIVNLFIINTPHNCVSKHKCVDIFKSFGFNGEQKESSDSSFKTKKIKLKITEEMDKKTKKQKKNEMCLSRLVGHSALKTFFVSQVLIQNELSRLGQGTIKKNEEIYSNFASGDYVSNSIISLVENTLTEDCFLNASSLDQIGQSNFNSRDNIYEENNSSNSSVVNTEIKDCSLKCLSLDQIGKFNLDANAKYTTSFGSGILEENSLISPEYSDLSTNTTFSLMDLIAELKSTPDLSDSSPLYLCSSINAKSGANNFNEDLEKRELATLEGLDNANKTLASTTNFILYHNSFSFLSRSAIPLFTLRPISIHHSVNPLSSSCLSLFNISSFQDSCLAFASMDTLINPDQLISGNFFICSLTDSGTDKVMLTILDTSEFYEEVPEMLAFLSTPNYVKKHKNVEIYKAFDFVKESEAMNISEYAFDSEQSKTFFVDAPNNTGISATAQNQILNYGVKKC